MQKEEKYQTVCRAAAARKNVSALFLCAIVYRYVKRDICSGIRLEYFVRSLFTARKTRFD